MNVLVVASEPLSAQHLRAELEGDPADIEVMVVAPALHSSALRFWLSDADDAIARAERVQRETVAGLEREGVEAAGDIGEGDVAEAVADVLATFKADRILIFAHPSDRERYNEDVDPEKLSREVGVPVRLIELPAEAR